MTELQSALRVARRQYPGIVWEFERARGVCAAIVRQLLVCFATYPVLGPRIEEVRLIDFPRSRSKFWGYSEGGAIFFNRLKLGEGSADDWRSLTCHEVGHPLHWWALDADLTRVRAWIQMRKREIVAAGSDYARDAELRLQEAMADLARWRWVRARGEWPAVTAEWVELLRQLGAEGEAARG